MLSYSYRIYLLFLIIIYSGWNSDFYCILGRFDNIFQLWIRDIFMFIGTLIG